jgi:hypothetical protein
VGLLGHYPFDGNARDASSNAWHGDVVASTTEVGHGASHLFCPGNGAQQHHCSQAASNFFTNDSAVGSHAARFEGTDGYIQLPPRQFGGAFSISVWVKVVTAQRYA